MREISLGEERKRDGEMEEERRRGRDEERNEDAREIVS